VPTYQYACTSCDHRFEAVQSFSDSSLTECPACPGVLRKVFSAVGIVFKGSGFYRTDSRAGAVPTGSANGENGAKSESKTDNGSSGEKSTSSESKKSESTSIPSTSSSTRAPAKAAAKS